MGNASDRIGRNCRRIGVDIDCFLYFRARKHHRNPSHTPPDIRGNLPDKLRLPPGPALPLRQNKSKQLPATNSA
jgi:hypothetical protein